MLKFKLAAIGRLLVAAAALGGSGTAQAQKFVPGTGHPVPELRDDFEDEYWAYVPNGPKSSREQDEKIRYPLGQSTNGRWIESIKRGHPDLVRRVETPAGGLPGSQGALLMQTLYSAVPGRLSGKMEQDDVVMNSSNTPYIPVSQRPSAVVRVYLPPFEQWERRTGSTFGFRAEVQTTKKEEKGFLIFKRKVDKIEPYWPGFFIQLHSRHDPRFEKDEAVLLIRCDASGEDIVGPRITKTGWWTLGMSFSPDGRVHYYARPGVEDLTEKDYIASHEPYGLRCERFNTIFFNVCNNEDGRTWSTAWIVDDPTVYQMGDHNRFVSSPYPSR